jgi:D-xylose transport system substrate-binding protein
VDKVAGTAPFTTPGKNNVSSIIIAPHPMTKDTLQTVIDAGWITKADLCKDVPAASAPAACK